MPLHRPAAEETKDGRTRRGRTTDDKPLALPLAQRSANLVRVLALSLSLSLAGSSSTPMAVTSSFSFPSTHSSVS